MFGRKSAGKLAARTAKATKKAAKRTAKANERTAKATAKAAKRTAEANEQAAKRTAKANEKGAKRTASANEKVAKASSKAVKADTKATKAATKAAARSAKADAKAATIKAKQPTGLIGTLTSPKTATRAMAVAKIVGPTVAPYALRAATTARGLLDERRAVKLGVSPDEVAAYRGPTGPAGARIAGLRSSIEELRRRRATDQQVTRFSDVAKARLADLDIAVHTSASMPAARRRGTLVAVDRELNQIEADLMTHLVPGAR